MSWGPLRCLIRMQLLAFSPAVSHRSWEENTHRDGEILCDDDWPAIHRLGIVAVGDVLGAFPQSPSRRWVIRFPVWHVCPFRSSPSTTGNSPRTRLTAPEEGHKNPHTHKSLSEKEAPLVTSRYFSLKLGSCLDPEHKWRFPLTDCLTDWTPGAACCIKHCRCSRGSQWGARGGPRGAEPKGRVQPRRGDDWWLGVHRRCILCFFKKSHFIVVYNKGNGALGSSSSRAAGFPGCEVWKCFPLSVQLGDPS